MLLCNSEEELKKKKNQIPEKGRVEKMKKMFPRIVLVSALAVLAFVCLPALAYLQTEKKTDESLTPQSSRPDILWMGGGFDGIFGHLTSNQPFSLRFNNSFTGNLLGSESPANPPCTTVRISLPRDIPAYGETGTFSIETNEPNCYPTDIVQTGGNSWFRREGHSRISWNPRVLELHYTADPNMTGAIRYYSFSYSGVYGTGSSVAGGQRGDCVVLITDTSETDTFPRAGGQGTISYQASPNCPANPLQVEGGWITLESNTTFRVQPMNASDPQFRIGAIKVGDFRQTIKQGDATTVPTPRNKFLHRTKSAVMGVRG